MTETFKIILTSSLTIIGGIFIYVFGQIADKFFIRPIFEQKQIIGDILDSLIFYANDYTNKNRAANLILKTTENNKYHEINQKFRQLAALLMVKTSLIPCYNFFAKLKIVVKKEKIESAHFDLIRMSNGIYEPIVTNINMAEVADEIKKYLFNN